MANEIEQHLLAKLKDGLKDNSQLGLHPQFLDLQKLIETKLSQSPNEDMSKLCREKLYQLNNLLIEYKTVSKKKFNFQHFGGRLKKIRQELQGNEGSAPSNVAVTPPREAEEVFRWSSRLVDPRKVHGFDDEARSLERLLVEPEKDDQFKAIGIVGMGGVGKTTLCQLIFNNQEVKNHFLPRIWVCMSKQPNQDSDNRKEIVKRMLRRLGVEEEIINFANENHGLRGLIFALHLQLRGKKYLIVLDDAWNGDECFAKCFARLDSKLTRGEEWEDEKLAHGLPKECGGTVIVTSRSENIAKNMVGENLRRLLSLSDKESCWNIFRESVGKEFTPDMERMKGEILNKCHGLPLAAKMMGQIKHEQLEQIKKNLISKQNSQNHNHQASQ